MKWYKNPIVLLAIAIPLATVLGSAYTIYLAVSSKEAPILESYRKQGLTPVKVTRKDTDITALFTGEALQLQAQPPVNEDLRLLFEHPTRAKQDWELILKSQGDNHYPLPPEALQALRQERWYLRLQPLDQRWHLNARTYDRENRDRLRERIEFISQ